MLDSENVLNITEIWFNGNQLKIKDWQSSKHWHKLFIYVFFFLSVSGYKAGIGRIKKRN